MHLTIRVAWHDNRWNGTVCSFPSKNVFCTTLENVREHKNDAEEDKMAGVRWDTLESKRFPPCVREAGAFMSPRPFKRLFDHPYAKSSKETHGHLKLTWIDVPEYSTFAVPFWWMLKENQKQVDEMLPDMLPTDTNAPFPTPWVFGRERQQALTEHFFGCLQDEKSLVFFYCKDGQPLGDTISRLVVGVGQITKVGKLDWYDSDQPRSKSYPLWDRVIRHSIRPDGVEGFLLPYHDYLESTGDHEEDARRLKLFEEIAVAVAPEHIRTFSYVSDLARWDATLSVLARCLDAVRLIKEHGIAKGPWERREEWLNQQIAAVWKERGAFPGLGAALEAIGVRLGSALALDLVAQNIVKSDDDPWPIVDAMLRGIQDPPKSAYKSTLMSAGKTWVNLGSERQAVLKLLSRFDLTVKQLSRWFVEAERRKSCEIFVPDSEVLANPYRISEVDLGDDTEGPITVSTIDRGILPDSTIAAKHPLPEPSKVSDYLDHRRVRAVLVAVLRNVEQQGDTLLSEVETIERVDKVDLAQPCTVTADWIIANQGYLSGVIERFGLPIDSTVKEIPVLQLTTLKKREDALRKILIARAGKDLPSTKENWASLLRKTINIKEPNPQALDEQAQALERITTRKLSVLTGRAGTGKTSVLGALLRCKPIADSGILLLAPTGKARVRLGKSAQSEAMTIGQFLYRQERYDPVRQRSLPDKKDGDNYHKERTVVIDECSMLTLNDFVAVLNALDLAHVQRIILVGDPNQLPPIGVGRPFADLCASLEASAQSEDAEEKRIAQAMGRLTVEVRTTSGNQASDTLKFASWFTREQQPADADEILDKLEHGEDFNDLEIHFWETHDELYERIYEQFQKHLNLTGREDWEGFNKALGIGNGNQGNAESFQILSPVRMQPHGVYAVNRLVQKQYRGRLRRYPLVGDEAIGLYDKVIQIQNQERNSYENGATSSVYLANGEIGLVTSANKQFINVNFADRNGISVGYRERDFPSGSGPLELAYALTVHKTQGSEFDYVFVIIPKNITMLSRELLYTAFTRSKRRLVLLVEGANISALFEYTRPEKAESARRNTNLFTGTIRSKSDDIPYSEHLIHKALKGHLVRSKSELVIANILHQMDISYQYEQKYEGSDGRVVRPDFLFTDPAGDVIIWEHLGLLTRDDYRRSWGKKKAWYEGHGFIVGKTLFTTEDDEHGGLDSITVRKIAETIKSLL